MGQERDRCLSVTWIFLERKAFFDVIPEFWFIDVSRWVEEIAPVQKN